MLAAVARPSCMKPGVGRALPAMADKVRPTCMEFVGAIFATPCKGISQLRRPLCYIITVLQILLRVRQSILFMPGKTIPHRWWHIADRVGAAASLLCAVHCAVLPFVLALLPLLGLGFLEGHTFERVFVLCAATLASVALVVGYRRHHRRGPLLLALPGLCLLVAGVCVDLDTALVAHAVMVTIGGTLLACAHLVNLRFSRVRHVHELARMA